MDRSIEKIWKNGFLKKDALVAPKLNDLYNQRSLNVVDKLFRMGKINLIFIMVGALVVLAITYALDILFSGIGVFILLSITVYYGQKQGEKAKEISKGLNSHQYLVEVNKWLQKTIDGYTYMYRFIYPAFVILFTLGAWYSSIGNEMFGEMLLGSPDLYTIFGVPLVFWGVLVVVAAFFSAFAKAIYMADLNTIYGGVFKKMDALLAEMEELSLEN